MPDVATKPDGKAKVETVAVEADVKAEAEAAMQTEASQAEAIAKLQARTEAAQKLLNSRKKFAIVGFTHSNRHAPYGDEEWVVAGCNNLHLHLPAEKRLDLLFDLHSTAEIMSDKQHVAWLEKGETPVFVWEPRPDWPSSIAFPRQAVMAQAPPVNKKPVEYFTNSISWMIGFALAAGMEEIGIYGVDMATAGEYSSQRPSCEFWVAVAATMGVEVTIAEGSDLLRANSLYGLESDSPLWGRLTELQTEREAKKQEAVNRLAQLDHERGQIIAMVNQLDGALQTLTYLKGTQLQPAIGRDGKVKE